MTCPHTINRSVPQHDRKELETRLFRKT